MKVLVTGAAGLFGVNYSRYLMDKGYDVIGIDNLSGGYMDFVDERIVNNRQFHEVDITSADGVEALFAWYKPEIVFHFAAYAAEGLSHYIRNFNYTTNMIGSTNIINNCVKYNAKKIIFTSSMGVYGNISTPYYESQTPQPEDPYAISKYGIELDLASAKKIFGLDYTIIRPHNVVGIYQNIWDNYRNVIGIWIRKVLNDEPITIFGDGHQIRSFSDIKYYMEPLEKTINPLGHSIYNIGAEEYFELLEVAYIVQRVGRQLGYKSHIIHLEPREEVKVAYCNHDLAKKDLEFKDETNLEKLIYDMFVWAAKQPKREVKKMDYELTKGIYSYWK